MNKNNLPMPVKGKPYPHQQETFDFVCGLFGLLSSAKRSDGAAILAEMGCGKTYIFIAILGALFQKRLIKRCLIVAPITMLQIWEKEIQNYADYSVNTTVLCKGTKKKKEQLANIPNEGLQVILVNYESTWRITEELLQFDADIICADEGHKIKDSRRKQSKAMHILADRAKYRCLLTGILIGNSEIDVFSEYRFVNKEIFGSNFFRFRGRYFDMLGYKNREPVFREYMAAEFLEKVHSVAFRVTKAECLELPQVTEEVRYVELESKAMWLYTDLQESAYTELAGEPVTAKNILTKLLRLSQITGGYLTDDKKSITEISQAKIKTLDEIIDSVLLKGEKLVVMARFVPELDAIEDLLKNKGIGYAVIRGGVKNRDEEIRKFQENVDCKVFVGNITTAGLGITLTAASTMVFYSMDYSKTNFEQAKDRIHRISQKKPCTYIYLVARGTVDEKVMRAIKYKINLAKKMMDDYRKGKNPFQV